MQHIHRAPAQPGPRSWQCLSATALKLIAALLMLADHIHQMFVSSGAPLWLSMAGRPVFPLFLFAAAEGFAHTRSRKNYLRRLLFASWGMSAMTFALQRIIPNEGVVLMNNAFSTFFVAGLYMLFWDRLAQGVRERSAKRILLALAGFLIPVLCALPIYLIALLSFRPEIPGSVIRLLAAASLLLPNLLTVEGGAAMVLLGLAFYVLRRRRVWQIAALLLLSVLTYAAGGGYQWLMALAALPIALYNGRRGRGMKHFFYVFYPAHIAVLYVLSALLPHT